MTCPRAYGRRGSCPRACWRPPPARWFASPRAARRRPRSSPPRKSRSARPLAPARRPAFARRRTSARRVSRPGRSAKTPAIVAVRLGHP
eukprot:6122970-Pyramimonas_sp.AAC.1